MELVEYLPSIYNLQHSRKRTWWYLTIIPAVKR